MTVRRALLVGAQTGGLRGVLGDVERTARVLVDDGFVLDVRTGDNASRAGILDGLDRLIRDTTDGDTAWFYYAGHGARVGVGTDLARMLRSATPREVRYLVPTDHAAGDPDDFRGITAWELSLKLAALTERSRDVAMILDCCHAARVVRGANDPCVRGLPDPTGLRGLPRYLDALRAAGARFDLLDPLGNSHAVRMFATGESSYAWERLVDGAWRGVFTDALLACLERARHRTGGRLEAITWEALGAVVREHVAGQIDAQRTELAGPVARMLCSADEIAGRRAVGVAVSPGRVVVRAGQVAGVSVGDVYELMPLGIASEAGVVAALRATVTSVGPFEACAALDEGSDAPGTADTADLVAYARIQARPPFAIRFDGDDAARQALAAIPWLRVDVAGDARITVAHIGAWWTIADRAGPLRAPVSGPEAFAEVLAALADLAAVDALGRLDSAGALVRDSVALHLCRSGDDQAPPLDDGTLLMPGDRVELSIASRTPIALFVHVFAVAPHGAITQLTHDARLGLSLAAHHVHVLGGADVGTTGIRMRWPDGLPASGPRDFELLVIAATRAVDLGFLERRVSVRAPVTRTALQARDVVLSEPLESCHPGLGYVIGRRRYRLTAG